MTQSLPPQVQLDLPPIPLSVAQVQFDRRYARWVETGSAMHAEICLAIYHAELEVHDPRALLLTAMRELGHFPNWPHPTLGV